MKKLLIAFTLPAITTFTLYSQNKTLKGRLISEFLDPMAGVEVLINDTATVGVTDAKGFFQINIPTGVKQISFRAVGVELTTIHVSDTCNEVEVVTMLDATYDFKTLRQVDRLRMRRFKKLPELHRKAFEQGLFKTDKACYTQEFMRSASSWFSPPSSPLAYAPGGPLFWPLF